MQANFNIHEPLNLSRPRLGMGLSLSAMIIFSALSIAKNPPLFKVYASLMGMFSGGVGMMYAEKLREHEPIRILKKEAKLELFSQLAAIQAMPGNGWGAPQTDDWEDATEEAVAATGQKLYDWNDLVDEAVGVILAGNSGSGKSSVASWLLGKFTEQSPARIRVLDPHYNDIWEEIGLQSFGEFDEIQSELEWAIAELDRRRICKKNKQPLGDDYIFVADEIGACLEEFENPEVVTKALKRLGSEGRKFGLTLIAIDQSSNCADLGISAKKRDNFMLIGLCSVAVALGKENLRNTDETMLFLQSQAYPCVVKFGGNLIPAIHPTHHSYSKFKKKGNPPLNLLPINQIQDEFIGRSSINLEKSPEPAANQSANDLNRLLSLDCGVAEPIEPIADDWDGTGDIPPHITAELVQGIRRGLSKNQIIVEILGTPKGGSKRYKSLSQYHDELRKNIL